MDVITASQSVVLAEDDDDFRFLLATLLRGDGHPVREFSDGQSLSEYLVSVSRRGGGPVLVVADVVLPGMTGLAACREARTAGCSSPFIFMSTFNDETTLLEAIDLGPTAVFRKPFEVEALLRVVAEMTTTP